jgi:hypothetical protein
MVKELTETKQSGGKKRRKKETPVRNRNGIATGEDSGGDEAAKR